MSFRQWLSPCFVLLLASSSGRAQEPAYLNPSLSPQERAHDLVSRMTLEEKAAQLEDYATAIPRLGVPDYQTWNEALHGVARAGYVTVFPQAIGMAATWDPAAIHTMGDTISQEARAIYNQAQREGNHRIFFGLTFWSPNINIFRDPRWGRGQETYGEDPFLTGRMGSAFIGGVQGPDLNHLRAVATSKHFAVHSGPESLRHTFNTDPTPRDLEETYLPAFRATVTEGKVQSVMCAYNSIDKFRDEAVDNLIRTQPRPQPRFLAKQGGRFRVVAAEEADYFSIDEGMTALHCGGQRCWMDVSLAELEKRLDPAAFVRVSREHVVRIAAIAEVLPLVGGYAEVALRSGERLPVSRRRLKSLLDILGAIH
jgi:hypothetical protein